MVSLKIDTDRETGLIKDSKIIVGGNDPQIIYELTLLIKGVLDQMPLPKEMFIKIMEDGTLKNLLNSDCLTGTTIKMSGIADMMKDKEF